MDAELRLEDVAVQIGVTAPMISLWEMNRSVPSVHHVPAIIEYLGYCPFEAPHSLGEWLKQCRISWGLSQEALAKAISMDESTIAKWERGDHMPIQRSLEKVRVFFESGDSKIWTEGNPLSRTSNRG